MTARESTIMTAVDGWVPGSLKEPVPGLGKAGEAEPVYHTKRYVAPIVGLFDKGTEGVEEAKWDAGIKVAKV